MFTMSINVIHSHFKKILLSNTVIVTIGILIGSFFSYLLQFFLGRSLSVEDYGTFNAMLSITYLVGVPSAVFGTSIIKISSELLAKKRFDKLTSLFTRLNLYALYAGTLLFVILFLLKNQISNYLNIEESMLIIPLGIYLGLSYINIVPASYLQGLMRFKAYAFYVGASSFIRLIIPTALVFLGFRVYGIFYGFSLGLILSFVLSYILLKKNLTANEDMKEEDLYEHYKRILSFSSSVIFINFGLMALNNLDMIMVKKFFDNDLAGYYAGTVTLGKIFLFGAGTVATVMFPQISNLYAKKSKLLYSKFLKLLAIQVLFVFLGTIAFSIFPKLLTVLFFGDRFIHSVNFLPHFSIFIAIYVLINFMVLFFMAIDKTKVFIVLLLATVSQYLLLLRYHSSIAQVININISISLGLLILLISYLFYIRKKLIF